MTSKLRSSPSRGSQELYRITFLWYSVFMSEVSHISKDDFEKSPETMTEAERIAAALALASNYGGIDGDHHKMWVIDQMVRVMTGSPIVKSPVLLDGGGNNYTFDMLGESEAYEAFVSTHNDDEDGSDTYQWVTGIAP